eukprot:gene1345-1362_t
MELIEAARGFIPVRRRVRIGVTGLRRAGKTSLLTSLAVNLLATGRGTQALPAFTKALAGRRVRVALAPSGAESMPRFDAVAKSASLAADPPTWPRPTDAVSLLALDIDISQAGVFSMLPDQMLRLEFLDYPGEWLLDLPLLAVSFPSWSAGMLRRLEPFEEARGFLGFVRGLPSGMTADEALIANGHALYVTCLKALQARGLSLLQPGRFLMPPPGAAAPWAAFFPIEGSGGLARLMQDRFDAYVRAVRAELAAPGFANIDRLVVIADLLSALHAGRAAFEDAAQALALVAHALSSRKPLPVLPSWLQPWGIGRIAFVASKADHVAQRQRANLASLMARLIAAPEHADWRAFAVAGIACTEDFVWTLDGRPISAVRGHVAGQGLVRSYPGEVPDRTPNASDWAHPFLSLPDFTPKRLDPGGRGAIPQMELDQLLVFLLEDMLLEPEALPMVLPTKADDRGTLAMVAWGAGILVAGLSALSIGNFVADQFARAQWLGWLTLGVAAGGTALIGAAVWREIAFLHRLDAVDRLRADLADPARAKQAAKRWLAGLPGVQSIAPALDTTDAPEAIAALLRAGPARVLEAEAQALGRSAALQMLAVTAAVPSPALDGVIVTLRGVRLVRQVASLYGFRPGTLGTIALLRRVLLSGVYVTSANIAVDTLVKAAISNPHLQHLAGDVAGAGVAARRMIPGGARSLKLTRRRPAARDCARTTACTGPLSRIALEIMSMSLGKASPLNRALCAIGPLVIDTRCEAASQDGIVLKIGRRAIALLICLARHQGEAVSKDTLMQAAWNGLDMAESNLTSQMLSLRRGLAAVPGAAGWIETLPRRGYRLVPKVTWLDAVEVPETTRIERARELARLLPPSIAVMPFTSSTPLLELLAVQLCNDVVAMLAGLREIIVISGAAARAAAERCPGPIETGLALGVRYMITARVHARENAVEAAIELLEVDRGAVLWSRSFPVPDAASPRITVPAFVRIVHSIAPRVREVELRRIHAHPHDDLTVYHLLLRAEPLMSGHRKAQVMEAHSLIERALAHEPASSRAHEAMALCYDAMLIHGWLPDRDAAIAERERHAMRAIALDGLNVTALARAGHARARHERDYTGGRALLDRALDAGPNIPKAWELSSFVLSWIGDGDAALRHAEHAMHLSPFDPQMPQILVALCLAHYTAGDYRKAIDYAARSHALLPRPGLFLAFGAASAGALGDKAQAALFLAKMHPNQPRQSVTDFACGYPYREERRREKLARHLHAAGLAAC